MNAYTADVEYSSVTETEAYLNNCGGSSFCHKGTESKYLGK